MLRRRSWAIFASKVNACSSRMRRPRSMGRAWIWRGLAGCFLEALQQTIVYLTHGPKRHVSWLDVSNPFSFVTLAIWRTLE
jgi:hypothetical protein